MATDSSLWFIFDSDALIQIFVAEQQGLFQILLDNYGIRSFMMNEVDTEIRSNRKHGGRIKPWLDKAVKSGLLRMISAGDLESLKNEAQGGITLADIRSLGFDYNIYVETGEAYTHAAGVLLQMPVVSNDRKAIDVLEQKGKTLPPTILRSFDLFAFLYAEGFIDDKAANLLLKNLKTQLEWCPPCFKNASFVNGMSMFACRLQTSLSINTTGSKWSDSLYLGRVDGQTDSESALGDE